MTQFLPPNLLALFAPRDPIQYLAPPDKLPHEKRLPPYNGVSSYINLFEDPKDTPPPTRVETREERQERKRREKQEQVAYKLEQDIALWDPHNAQGVTTDPFKTLFVSRVNYYSSEHKLRREFETYGPIKKIHIVQNTLTGKQKGYAFIEYEHERDMHSAYKHADGKKIDGRRVLVDVERSRTVKGWLPRRLGGGLGGTRRGGPDVNIKISGREDYRDRGDDRYESRDGDRGERGDRGDRGDRDRDRGGRMDRDRRSRSRDKERRRRSRSRSHERRRERRTRRSRSRERDRDRGDKGNRDRGDREQMGDTDRAVIKVEDEEKSSRPERPEREKRRSRSRDRERKRRRSRSRSKDRKRRDRDRSRREERNERPDKEKMVYDPDIQIKKEPADDYPDFPPAMKAEDTDDRKENIRQIVENTQNGDDFENQD